MEEKVKLDQVVKSLFEVSTKAMIGVINECFNKNYQPEEIEIEQLNPNFIMEHREYEKLQADLILRINESKYHIEFQTKNDTGMEIRMFEYGFYFGRQEAHLAEDGIMTLEIPNQAVIFIEENKNVRDQKLRIVFPSKEEIIYDIATVRLWQYSIDMMVQKQMYNMLPLIIFGHRKMIMKLTSTSPKMLEEKQLLLNEINYIGEKVSSLIKMHQLEGEDVHKISLAMNNLIEYLNINFIKDDDFGKEVYVMTKTLYDPLVEQRGIEKGIEKGIKKGIKKGIEKGIEKGRETRNLEIAQNMLQLGMNREDIKKVTGLSEEEIEKLEAEK